MMKKSDQIYIMLGTGLFAYKLSDKLGIRLTTFKSADIRYDFVVEDSDTFVAVTGDKSGNKRIVVYSSSDAYAAYNSTKEASDSAFAFFKFLPAFSARSAAFLTFLSANSSACLSVKILLVV